MLERWAEHRISFFLSCCFQSSPVSMATSCQRQHWKEGYPPSLKEDGQPVCVVYMIQCDCWVFMLKAPVWLASGARSWWVISGEIAPFEFKPSTLSSNFRFSSAAFLSSTVTFDFIDFSFSFNPKWNAMDWQCVCVCARACETLILRPLLFAHASSTSKKAFTVRSWLKHETEDFMTVDKPHPQTANTLAEVSPIWHSSLPR